MNRQNAETGGQSLAGFMCAWSAPVQIRRWIYETYFVEYSPLEKMELAFFSYCDAMQLS
jgi:hypothetical protein